MLLTEKNKPMKKLVFACLAVFSMLSVQNAQAQFSKYYKSDSTSVNNLEKQKKTVEKNEQQIFDFEMYRIEELLESGEITSAEAEKLRQKAEAVKAKNITDQKKIIDETIVLLERNQYKGNNWLDYYYTRLKFLDRKLDSTSIRSQKIDTSATSRTDIGIVMAFGFSNTIGSGQSLKDNYKLGGSRFFEVGLEFRTPLMKSGFLRLNYGVNFQFDGLKPKDNQHFVKNGNETKLEDFGDTKLKKSKFRMDNVVVPIHFEIGKTNKNHEADGFKLGVGGFAGLNMNTMQKLKYKEGGHKVTHKKTGNYNTEKLMYGLSGYVGYDNLALYAKYNLNPVFKDNENDENIIAAGLRLSF